jgi:hypothetical protein
MYSNDFNMVGKEYRADSTSIVPIGGLLPYYIETRKSRLLDFLVNIVVDTQSSNQSLRKRIDKYLYSKSRPGFYLEINEHLHLAYADQRDGHGSQHWWRLFFDNNYRQLIEQFTRGTALAVPGKGVPKTDNTAFNQTNDRVGTTEWGGMYFRSLAEIKIAEELDKQEVLFFANTRGRVGRQGAPVSEASGWLTGRVEIDFLVFYKGRCMILEVDGQHHQEGTQTVRDYIRDRVLLREGIPTVRFTANECFNQPANVVAEFLNIFSHSELANRSA